MLRILLKNHIGFQRQCLSTVTTPSTKTSVLLRRLPASLTEANLVKALGELNCRKVLLEPGCAVHVLSEAEADYAASCVEGNTKLQAAVRSTTMPTVLLHNIPHNASRDDILHAFKDFKPLQAQILGNFSTQVTATSARQAVAVSCSLEAQHLQASTVKLADDSYCIHVAPSSSGGETSAADADSELTARVSRILADGGVAGSEEGPVSVRAVEGPQGRTRSFRLRLPSHTDPSAVTAALNKLTSSTPGLSAPIICGPTVLPRPALFLRNVKCIPSGVLAALQSTPGAPLHRAVRVHRLQRGKDVASDLAVAYFDSEADAMGALGELRKTLVDGVKLSVSYKEVSEPAVLVKGLPATATEDTVLRLFGVIRPLHVEMLPPVTTDTSSDGGKGSTSAIVLLSGPRDVRIAVESFNDRRVDKDGNQLTKSSRPSDAISAGGAEGEGGLGEREGGRTRKTRERLLSWRKGITVEEYSICDTGFEVSFPAESGGVAVESGRLSALLGAALEEAGLRARELVPQTGRSASIVFETLAEATAAHLSFQKNFSATSPAASDSSPTVLSVAVGGSVTSRLTVSPSWVVQVAGLDPNEPATGVLECLEAGSGPAVRVVRFDRSGLLKFRRHKEVYPGVKKLKGLRLPDHDAPLSFCRYAPLDPPLGVSEYDEQGDDEKFDGSALRTLMSDYMSVDPSTRFGVAKNAFERALQTAIAQDKLDWLVDSTATPEIKAEIKSLLRLSSSASELPRSATDRLFELFLQKDDMIAFSHDFDEMAAMIGPPDESDAFDWSQFSIKDAEELRRLYSAVTSADKEALDEGFEGLSTVAQTNFRAWKPTDKELKKKTDAQKRRDMLSDLAAEGDGSTSDSDAMGNDDLSVLSDVQRKSKTIMVRDVLGADEVEVAIDPLDPTGEGGGPASLTDKDGRVWSGAILDQDITQKTMPGNRVSSTRVLVVVGNMRGAAGFGMGKGKTAALAVNAAFRDALRNLTFIDLYDNFGIAHDLHGKHNSCHAYIMSTPRDRIMKGSPFAQAILLRFGIGAASVKLVGRRDPYSMVRAMFNAIAKHENIDEYAKARGLRYLTKRWEMSNGI